MSSTILDFSPRTWLALGGTAVALLSGAVFFFRSRSTKLLPGKAPTPAVGFPLGIFNAIHSILKGLGLPSPFKIPKQKYINEAKRLAAIKGAEEFFGNQDEFVEAVSVFLNSVKEETMSASGVLLLNGMLNRFFEMRANLIDYALKHPEIENYPLIKPIIITGLPRTGSTMLYNLMACDERARAPRFFEISHMAFIAPPNHSKEERENDVRIQECIERFNRVERSYPNLFTEAGKSHRSHPAELEEEVLIMFQAFIMQLWVPLTRKPYHDFYNSPDKKDAAYAFLKTALQVVNSGWQPESHWVLKAPVHSHYLETLVKFFPDARVVFTHRDPTNVVPSWARLLETFLSWYYKENTLDRHELGDYVMESLLSCGENVKEFRQKHDPSTYIDIDYADLFKQPVETVERIYHHFGLEVTEDFREKMRQWMRENRQGKYGRAYYTLEDYGQTDDGVINSFAWYIKDFLPSMHGKLAELEQKQKK